MSSEANIERRRQKIRRLRRGVALVMAVMLGGCGAPANKAPAPPQKTPSLALDPCAEQLHEIAGVLLEYYAVHRALPASVEELKAQAPEHGDLFVCPVSRKAYVYDRAGIPAPQGSETYGRVILYDAVPVHRGMRWGIAVAEGGATRQLVTRVIALPGNAATTRESVPWK